MKKFILKAVCILLPWQIVAQAEEDLHPGHDHSLEEIVVTAAQPRARADTAFPVNVLSGEKLKESATKTLGDTLHSQAGVSSASFGPGVGQPVIRGQTSNRVRVLQDGVGTLDASLASQDHANAVETLVAERIEVIRGPATLLYGNGAIGGVVNVIDNRIPEKVPEALKGELSVRHNTVSEEDSVAFKVDGGSGNVAWHIDGLTRESDNVEVPGLAVDAEALEQLEELLEDNLAAPGGDAGMHEEEEVENTNGFIANSDTEANNLTVGISWVGDDSFFGISVNSLENEYGLPPGAHGHEEEGHEAEEEEEEEVIRIDMEQTRIDLKGASALSGYFNEFRGRLTVNDYEHAELEGADQGTVFSNEGWEGRFTLRHGGEKRSGVLGLQLGDREFSAVGDEAFIPVVDIQSTGLFAVKTIDRDTWVYEYGLRLDNQSIDPQQGSCNSDESTWAGSVAAIWRYREDSNWLFSINRAERAASAEELFSNIDVTNCQVLVEPVVHAATRRIEIGDPNLDAEVSQNIELAYRKHAGRVKAEVNFFYNQIDDYIYLEDVGLDDEIIESHYLQDDATFSGIEAELSVPFELAGDNHMDLRLFTDYVRAELDRGGNVPRIPPQRFGAEVSFSQQQWIVKFSGTVVEDQDDIGRTETATDGYTRFDLYFDYHTQVGSNDLVVFFKGNNLTDEEIRNHTSFLKFFAPEAGRGYEIGLRYAF